MKQPIYTCIPYSNMMQLVEDYSVFITIGGVLLKTHITIPKGFIWDGMSIPKFAWSTTGTPFSPKHVVPGLLHDWGYREPRSFGGWSPNRKDWDVLMLDILKVNDEGAYNRQKMYRMVRWFGGKAWRKHRGH